MTFRLSTDRADSDHLQFQFGDYHPNLQLRFEIGYAVLGSASRLCQGLCCRWLCYVCYFTYSNYMS